MDLIIQWSLNSFFIVYGMAFFMMGIFILLQPKKGSHFKLGEILWLLACFALIQGINEMLNVGIVSSPDNKVVHFIKLSCLVSSFVFLFEFGKRLLIASLRKEMSPLQTKLVNRYATWGICLLGGTIIYLASVSGYPEFMIDGGIWARYLLGFPGALLTGIGFLAYYDREETLLKEVRVKGYFLLTGFCFLLFSVLSGLVVPAGHFFPANWLNNDTFLDVMKMPVQSLRAVLAIMTAITVTVIMKIFEWEARRKLEFKIDEISALNEKLSLEIAMRQKAEDSLRVSLEESTRRQAEISDLTEDLQRSNAELQQFAYAASHDLREPLRAVAGFVKLLERRYRSQLDEKANEFMNHILDGITRMERLITDLLEYSRVGASENAFARINCSELLDEALKNLRSSIEESGAEVTSDALPEVMADPSQMSRVFQNLIANAIKFRGNEMPKIHISARKENGEWIFSVKDNGIGIDPKYFDKVFHVFQRLHAREEYEGTGIGLSICKKIVERHGGRIWVESTPGEGSTFRFTIPERP